MISLFTNFFLGHQTVLLIAFIIASILYLIYNHSNLYNVKINFKNFCFNSDNFKINVDSPACNINPIIKKKLIIPIIISPVKSPLVKSPLVKSTLVKSPLVPSTPVVSSKKILPNVVNLPIKS